MYKKTNPFPDGPSADTRLAAYGAKDCSLCGQRCNLWGNPHFHSGAGEERCGIAPPRPGGQEIQTEDNILGRLCGHFPYSDEEYALVSALRMLPAPGGKWRLTRSHGTRLGGFGGRLGITAFCTRGGLMKLLLIYLLGARFAVEHLLKKRWCRSYVTAINSIFSPGIPSGA
jgi:hypothetical protein